MKDDVGDFRVAIDSLVRSRGTGYVKTAFWPGHRGGTIHSAYDVPLRDGPRGYETIHGQMMDL